MRAFAKAPRPSSACGWGGVIVMLSLRCPSGVCGLGKPTAWRLHHMTVPLNAVSIPGRKAWGARPGWGLASEESATRRLSSSVSYWWCLYLSEPLLLCVFRLLIYTIEGLLSSKVYGPKPPLSRQITPPTLLFILLPPLLSPFRIPFDS